MHEGEQILFDWEGSINQVWNIYVDSRTPIRVSVFSGRIFITNYRIVAQGRLGVKGGRKAKLVTFAVQIRGYSREKERQRLIKSTTQQAVPCFGYQFQIKNIFNLRKRQRSITYEVVQDYHHYRMAIFFSSRLRTRENREKIQNAFEILKSQEKRRKLVGKTFCFKGHLTRITKKGAGKLLKAHGGRRKSSIVKSLSYLVTNHPPTMYKRVQKRDTMIITEVEFFNDIIGNYSSSLELIKQIL